MNFAQLDMDKQELIVRTMVENDLKVSVDQAVAIRVMVLEGLYSDDAMVKVLLGDSDPGVNKVYRVPKKIMNKYFVGFDKAEAEAVIEDALELWFGKA